MGRLFEGREWRTRRRGRLRRPGKRKQALAGSGRGRRKRPHPTPHHSRPYGYEGPSQATSQKTYLCKSTPDPTGAKALLRPVGKFRDDSCHTIFAVMSWQGYYSLRKVVLVSVPLISMTGRPSFSTHT